MTHTTVIILITVLVSLVAWQMPNVLARLTFRPYAVRQGQIDRFVTYGFVHADGWHLFFNMFTLFFFGRAIERLYLSKFGYLGFLLFYVCAVVVSVIPDFVKYQRTPHYTTLGASGAVSAVLFAFVLLYPWQLIYFFGIIPIPAILFAILYVGYGIYANQKGTGNINHIAHLMGAGFGVIGTILIEPRVLIHFANALMHPKF